MSVTTIKLDTEVRDRLSALAKKRELTLGELVNELVAKAEYEQYW
jgi:predicted transcriptional regulator